MTGIVKYVFVIFLIKT